MPSLLTEPRQSSVETLSEYSFNPVGMIPEFNALGNHPNNLLDYMDTHLQRRLIALRRGDNYARIRDYAIRVMQSFHERPAKYVGHHVVQYPQEYLSLCFLQALVDRHMCYLHDWHNFERALNLQDSGNNVLIVMNHTSVLDTYIMYTALMERFYEQIPISFMMSQNFLYVRLTALMTCGGDLFRTFQPKHIDAFRQKGGAHKVAATKMQRQNAQTLLELKRYCQYGGRMICLYPEKNRGQTMGAPEPRYLTLLQTLQPTEKQGRELYIMPMNTTGRHPIIPNAPGTNELDTIADRLQIGWGDTYCGKPQPLTRVQLALDTIGRQKVITDILGKLPTNCKEDTFTALGLGFLSMVAHLSPQDRGIYDNPTAARIAEMLS